MDPNSDPPPGGDPPQPSVSHTLPHEEARSSTILAAPPPVVAADDNEEEDAHSLLSNSDDDSIHEAPVAWDPFAASTPVAPPPPVFTPATTATAAAPAKDNTSAPVMAMPEPHISTVLMPGQQKPVMPVPPAYTPGYGMPPQIIQQVVVTPPAYQPPQAGGIQPGSNAYKLGGVGGGGVGDEIEKGKMYAPTGLADRPVSDDFKEREKRKQRNVMCYWLSCSAFSIYWMCALLLFLIPLGALLVFFYWSSRVQLNAVSIEGVSGSVKAPDDKALLMDVNVKVQITNKNSNVVNLTNVLASTWVGGNGGLLKKKSLGDAILNNTQIDGKAQSTVTLPIHLRFDQDTDPNWAGLTEVLKGCGRGGGGKRSIDMQVTTGATTILMGRDVHLSGTQTVKMDCPIPDDFTSDLTNQIQAKLKS